MENLIIALIENANSNENYDQMENIRNIINEFAITINAPSNWRDIGIKLAERYKNNMFIYELLQLWDYV